MDKLFVIFFVGCVVANGINGNDPNFFNFSPTYDYKPGFHPDIFARCWSEAGIPLAVALGDTHKWSYMCSPDYYRTCKNELPAALTVVAQLTPDQRDFVMSTLLSWVDGGAPYLCSLGLDYVLGIMNNGGNTCLREIVSPEIEKCNVQMMALATGLKYTPPYCSSMDNAMQCYLDAIVPCADDNLDNFLRDFFTSVAWQSPCSGSSCFTNAAVSLSSSSVLAIAVVATIMALINSFMYVV